MRSGVVEARLVSKAVDDIYRGLHQSHRRSDETHRNAIQAAACHGRRRGGDRRLFAASFRLLTFLPMLHTIEGYRRFVGNVMLKECAVTVVEDDTGIISFLARHGEEVRQLYTRPDRIGRGAGTQLIEAAKSSGVAALELWCFQANARARRFYEARGFRAIRFTDEERTPDVRYRWDRVPGSGRR